MTLPVLANDPGQIEQAADPAGYVRISILPDSLPPTGTVSVYVVYALSGDLLYVGQTADVRRRLLQHRLLRCSWWGDAATVAVIAGLSREEALAVERACIAAAGPRDNIQHNRRTS